MKTIRLIGVLFSTFAVGSVFAQVAPDFISVDAQHVYVQTGNSTTTVAPYNTGIGSAPFTFVVAVEGDNDLSGNTAPTFTKAAGSTYAGSLTLPLNGTNWRLSNYYATSTPFLAEFPNGTYTVTANTNTVSVSLAGDLFPSAPSVAITGGSGTWSGSTLSVNPGTNLIFTTNTFGWDVTGAETNGALFNHIGLFIAQGGSELAQIERFSNGANPYFTPATGTGNPNFATTNYTFTSGQYFVEMEFNAIVDIDTTGYPGVNAIALYTARTTFSIQVIPEPSAYAAIFGAAVCLGVVFQRRRALARVMIHRHRRMA